MNAPRSAIRTQPLGADTVDPVAHDAEAAAELGVALAQTPRIDDLLAWAASSVLGCGLEPCTGTDGVEDRGVATRDIGDISDRPRIA